MVSLQLINCFHITFDIYLCFDKRCSHSVSDKSGKSECSFPIAWTQPYRVSSQLYKNVHVSSSTLQLNRIRNNTEDVIHWHPTSKTIQAHELPVLESIGTHVYSVCHIRELLRPKYDGTQPASIFNLQCNRILRTTLQPHVTGRSEIWLSDTKESKVGSNLQLRPHAKLMR